MASFSDDLLKQVLKTVRSVKSDIRATDFLIRDLGFESIDVADLLFEIEQSFGISVTMRELNDYVLGLKNVGGWDLTYGQLSKLVRDRVCI